MSESSDSDPANPPAASPGLKSPAGQQPSAQQPCQKSRGFPVAPDVPVPRGWQSQESPWMPRGCLAGSPWGHVPGPPPPWEMLRGSRCHRGRGATMFITGANRGAGRHSDSPSSCGAGKLAAHRKLPKNAGWDPVWLWPRLKKQTNTTFLVN